MDDQGRIWFGEFAGERIGMFDTKTEKFQEWEVPGRFFAPYDAMADKNGNVWTAGMNADRVLRLDPKTGQFTQYPLPRYTNVRRVFVDNNTTPPTFWIGNNHGAALIKLEPQD
jgi:streptogramin lyase